MPEVVRRVRPTPTDAYLANPHKGCCTFQRFNGDPLFAGTGWSEEGPLEFPPAQYDVAPGYLPSTVSYCRWFWRAMEPEKGRFDFRMIDDALKTCQERRQTLAVRLMAYGSYRQPPVPDWYAERYPMIDYAPHRDTVIRAPVHDTPEYLEHWGGFVREFARRFDGHPMLESVDITYIGPWGEGAGECSEAQCTRFAELWKEAFRKTTRIAMIEGFQMRAGLASGAGWRCDCYGDMRMTGTPHVAGHLAWCHMYDSYPYEVAKGGAQDTWRTAPVHFETCWVPMHWYKQGWDLDFILEQGLKYHITYFMPKSTALPDVWLNRLAAFCRKIGYRFVFRQAIVSARASCQGGSFQFSPWIENVGVAPIYRRYDLALRLRQDDREEILPLTNVDIRTWLPGDTILDETVNVPDGFRPGWAELAIGILDPVTRQPKVRFAAKELFSDGWLSLGGIELT